jgi:tetratricopeptide (TPR) repeat protein
MRFSGCVNFLLLTCFTLPAAHADWSDAEIKAMPAYCEARLKRLPGQYEHWSQILGPDFLHTHHLCYGLGSINRYYRSRSPQEKIFNLNNANGDLTYVISHASPSYSLMPDAYLNRGLVLSLMGNNGGAIMDLNKALELNPKLARAYTLVSDIYVKLNKKGEALAVVTDGLRQVPDSPALQRLYKERGGKLPYPEPIARAAEAPAVPAQARREEETAEGAKPQDAVQLAPASPAPEVAGDGGRADVQAPATPKIGSPTNPWCRFCPDPAK